MADRFGVWTAVTEDLSARGCRLVTAELPRIGSVLRLTLWTDLFSESLEVIATAAWVSGRRVGVAYVNGGSRARGLSPSAWFDRIVEQGTVNGAGAGGSCVRRVVPVVVPRNGALRALYGAAGGAAPIERDPRAVVLPARLHRARDGAVRAHEPAADS